MACTACRGVEATRAREHRLGTSGENTLVSAPDTGRGEHGNPASSRRWGLRSEPLNLAEYMPDWPKRTLDIILPDGKIVENMEELRRALETNGTSVE